MSKKRLFPVQKQTQIKMEQRKVSQTEEVCPICHGEQIVFQPSGSKKSIRYIEVCRCVEEKCLCDKKPPYVYYDEKTETLVECSCAPARKKLAYLHKLFAQSGIPEIYRYRRLSEFEIRGTTEKDRKEITKMLAHAETLIADAKTSLRGVTYLGGVGSGKTFLVSLILNEIIYRHAMPVKFLKITREFFDHVRSTYNVNSPLYGQSEKILRDLANMPVLVIDDLGVQADSPWEQRTLYDLIDARYEGGRMTFVTSNLLMNQLKPLFSGRIYSRLQEMTRFQVLAAVTDYRDKYFKVDEVKGE